MNRLVIIVPCYNEQEVLQSTISSLISLLKELIVNELISDDSYLLFVDDGSKDNTWETICSQTDNRVHGLQLASNTGHQNALIAGYERVIDCCDMAVTIDADLQDDETKIRDMVKCYHEGYDIVYGVRHHRKTDSIFKRNSALAFYRFMKLMEVKTIYNHADFRLLSNRAIKELLRYEEQNLYLRGIVPLLGYPSKKIYYDRKKRLAGDSKYSLKQMLLLAFNGITSFSIKPMHFVLELGLAFIVFSIGILSFALYSKFNGHSVAGWTSIIISIWFCSGCILLCIGMCGEYVGRIYIEVKHRPRYIIRSEFELK